MFSLIHSNLLQLEVGGEAVLVVGEEVVVVVLSSRGGGVGVVVDGGGVGDVVSGDGIGGRQQEPYGIRKRANNLAICISIYL